MMGRETDDFEDDIFASQMEEEIIKESAKTNSLFTKEEEELITYCKACANGIATPSNGVSMINELQIFLKRLEESYNQQTIFFLMDLTKRANDCDHTIRPGSNETICKLSGVTYPISECVVFSLKIPNFPNPKNCIVHKKFQALVYALFFVFRFQECMIKMFKDDPNTTDAKIRNFLSCFKKSKDYVAYNLPIKTA